MLPASSRIPEARLQLLCFSSETLLKIFLDLVFGFCIWGCITAYHLLQVVFGSLQFPMYKLVLDIKCLLYLMWAGHNNVVMI